MEALGLTNRKMAERMDRAEGTVSKLLSAADPEASPMSADTSLPAHAGERLEELLAKALRPVAVEIRVDHVTLDRLFVFHFEDHPPIHIVVGICELTGVLIDLARVVSNSLN